MVYRTKLSGFISGMQAVLFRVFPFARMVKREQEGLQFQNYLYTVTGIDLWVLATKLSARVGGRNGEPKTNISSILQWGGTFRIGKRQPLHCFLRNADGTTQVDSSIE
ncbi:Hypothetical_protein [Hexamita inflata]|uniref:Hypothetical_protein n=1 Tax=Hexamita inflata TaxID=28002 RepID=A0AA86QZ85_9EUKA|nr:Hypothetical protein HINF_LOCUS54995 [Hexamita inflata]